MRTVELLSYLRNLGASLWVEGDRLQYNAPQGVLTPALRAELTERNGEIITFLRKARTVVRFDSQPLLRVPRGGELPLSFAQQQLWIIDQLAPGGSFYNIPLAVRLMGSLQIAALQKSLSEIVRRHDVLRATFTNIHGRPFQTVARDKSLVLPLVDLCELFESDREAHARRLAAEEARQPFDLAHGPLFRVRLLRLGEKDHMLLITMHHIISDGWSRRVLLDEFVTLYEAFTRGEPSPLPELSVQYADFAFWEKQWLRGEILEQQLSYWKQQLER